MTSIFNDCSKLTNLNINNFVTHNVTLMNFMFGYCPSLINLDLSTFDTSSVSDWGIDGMFCGCSSLTNLDLSNFNTSSVIDMSEIFYGCKQLKAIIVSSEWTASTDIYSAYMFTNCTSLVGGAGTEYNPSYIDATYAHIDGGESNPGYLTSNIN